METALIIIIGALAFRGAAKMTYSLLNGARQAVPYYFNSKIGFKFIQTYLFIAIPLAIYHGYVINGWIGLFVIGIGTWLGMLVANIFLKFNPAVQFLLFGLINIVWTIYNVIQLF